MNCPGCGSANPPAAKFCNQCAGPLPLVCAKCSACNPAGSKFCNGCAALLTFSSAPASAEVQSRIQVTSGDSASTPPEGERKTVTALFADIKGSMDLMEDLDLEEDGAIVDPALRLMI